MTYDELKKQVEKLGEYSAKAMDFDMWWMYAGGDIVREAEEKFPLTGKIRNPFDQRTKASKYIRFKKNEAWKKFNNKI